MCPWGLVSAQVNFFAVLAVTKAFLPSIKRFQLSHGGMKGPTHARIVMVTSLSSLFPGLPIMSAYCASKHAVESFTGSLRHEMAGWGIEVSKRH
jgi:short-subunit dehydrogenase